MEFAHKANRIQKMLVIMTAPSNAKTNPTERSMPPVMIINPIPRLKMPYIPIRQRGGVLQVGLAEKFMVENRRNNTQNQKQQKISLAP